MTKFFKKEFGKLTTIGLGDSLNDLPMLKVVDIPILVQKPNKTWEPKIKVKNLIKINAIGPRGWANAIKNMSSKNKKSAKNTQFIWSRIRITTLCGFSQRKIIFTLILS